MSNEGDGTKDLVEPSRHLHVRRESVENGRTGDRMEDIKSRPNRVGQDLQEDGVERVLVQAAQALGQVALSQGSAVCWKRFLHVGSVRVLLVEDDDSTRHVVAALLRNCSYEVVEASNGLQAWKILEDLTNRIDLVLSEVVMPCISGIALLYKIMSHKTRKTVPVIMMSSHDSMGVVFKCLSKGAVDFLVKPIRKNELKNLWQHVWRRCHSSSGSGSESGTQTQKSVKSKTAMSNDNSCSNDEEDNDSPALNFGDGSDHGSGTQSSWTKQAVEDQVDSPRQVSPSNEVPECPDSTCGQVTYPNAKPSETKMLSMTATTECREPQKPHENTEPETALDIGGAENSDLRPKFPVQVPTELTSMNQYSAPKLDSSQCSEQLDKRVKELNETKVENMFSEKPESSDKAIDERKETPSVEQGLNRLRSSQDTGKVVKDDKNVLRRSESSAFSRYNAALKSKVSVVDVQNPTPLANELSIKSEERPNIESHSESNALNQCLVSSSNNRLTEAFVSKNEIAENATTKSLSLCAFGFMKNNTGFSSQQAKLGDTDNATAENMSVPPVHSLEKLQVQAVDNIQHRHLTSNHENSLIRKMAEHIPHCGSSTILDGHVEGNAGNYSVNGSGSGSNYGSNEPNGSSSGANAGVINVESDNGAGGVRGSGGGSGSGRDSHGSGSGDGGGSGSKIDQSKLAQREAALTKFRQKRKERCFEKKVEYQSRKRLAEQRPRLRGQFVRQALEETTSRDTDS